MNKRSIFWFKRDLRVDDNTGLYYAVKESKEVIPLFILDPQILKKLNPNNHRLGFLMDALQNLENELKAAGSYLMVVEGDPQKIFPDLFEKHWVDALYLNKAYGFDGANRDKIIRMLCLKNRVVFKEYEDTFLVPPDRVAERKVFTPFYKLWSRIDKRENLLKITKINSPVLEMDSLERIKRDYRFPTNKHWPMDFPQKRLKEFDFRRYDQTRNFPYIDGTSRLSPYIRFGLVSIRKIYRAASSLAGDANTFTSELAWREFWYHIMHYCPETRELEFQEKRRGIKWMNKEKWYEAWKEGRTGYPIVDAGMRQLKEEGWIHNRVRMIVASFLTKDLLIDWRWGDKHFFHSLVDYDENVDIGNWQWAASVGADPKPLRIFNPILQSHKFDPECKYIKKYVPELKEVAPEMIHDPLSYDLPYYEPVVDHYDMSKLAKEVYKKSSLP
jgi:deoxyribodipyrimidine photo-lyase